MLVRYLLDCTPVSTDSGSYRGAVTHLPLLRMPDYHAVQLLPSAFSILGPLPLFIYYLTIGR